MSFPIPKSTIGFILEASSRGFQFIEGTGENSLNSRVTGLRMMDPVTTGKFQYPGGYDSYLNKAGQIKNPLMGKTISRPEWWWHIPAK